jgi:DNA-directed RNA polymerase
LRDEAGGKAVCLTVSNENDTPVDIYLEVANRVSDKVMADAKAGDKYAQIWLDESGESKVKRAIVKKPVMNYPYGVTKWTVFQEIWKAVKESKVMVLSTILCEIVVCQFLKEWQVFGNFSYGL